MTPGRDVSGHFVKGHPDFVKGTGAKIGRPKSIKKEFKDALSLAQDAAPDLIRAMIVTAMGEDDSPANVRQAAREYLIDRIYGKANQPLSGQLGINVIKEVEIIKDYGLLPAGGSKTTVVEVVGDKADI
jgi:hypothetical protein